MKLIDKYLLKTFLAPLTYCLLAFVLIFTIIDLFDNMQDFVEAKTAIGLVARYYVFLIPSVLVYIIPVSLLLSVLYSLSTLTKNNELTAMRASGVSLYRLMLPFMATGLAASMLVAFVNESFGPWSAYWTNQFLRSEKNKDKFNIYLINDLPYRNPRANREWLIGHFNSQTYDMDNITIKQFRDDGSIALKITAEKGQWLDGEWWFTDVVRQEYMDNGRPKGGAVELNFGQKQRSIAMTDFDEEPLDFLQVLKDARENPEQFSSMELYDYIQRNSEFSKKVVARATTDFHSRIAMPWTCLIVTILGIPFGAQTGRKGALVGVLSSLLLFFSFYVFISVFQALGKGQYIPPWVAGWAPNLIFFAFGAIMVHRMR
jgi:LPS export ABC transporter permease LptG